MDVASLYSGTKFAVVVCRTPNIGGHFRFSVIRVNEIKMLVPKDELDAALEDGWFENDWELAEYFSVTVSYISQIQETTK